MADSVVSVEGGGVGGAALYCPACMYDLRGLTGDACPECGAGLDRALLASSSIPWVHRKGFGWGAFLKTAWRATFQTDRFCFEMARPVSLVDARLFRRRVVWVLLALFTVAAGAITLALTEPDGFVAQLWGYSRVLSVGIGLLFVVLGGLFLMGWTGLHMYLFHPKGLGVEQQNRAVALSHYACAPLLGLVLPVVAIVSAIVVGVIAEGTYSNTLEWAGDLLGLSGALGLILFFAAYLFVCARMAQRTANRSGVVRLLLWLVLPVLWLVFAGLVFGVIPLVLFFIYVVFATV